MAAAMRRWAAGMMGKPRPQAPFPPSIYPTMLERVEGMKNVAPTEDTSKALLEIEDKLKTFHTLWQANERQVQGLFRDTLRCRAFITFATVGFATALVKGADAAYKFIINV